MGSDYSVSYADIENKENETQVIYNAVAKKYGEERYVSNYPDAPEIGTLYDVIEYTAKKFPDIPFLGNRIYANGKWQNEFKFMNRLEFRKQRDALGSSLRTNFPSLGQNVGILSHNRVEWVLAQHACYAYRYVPVPIYDTFGIDNMLFIINFAHLTHVFIFSTKVQMLLDAIDENCCLTDLIIIESEDTPFNYDQYRNHRIRFHKFNDLLSCPHILPNTPPKPQDPAFIMFTSGTSGNSKGVVISHSNMIATSSATIIYVSHFTTKDRYLSYLPLAHVFESILHVIAQKSGTPIAIYSGDIKRLTEEFKIIRPTVVSGVPRVFERIHEGVQAQLKKKSAMLQSVFSAAISIKSALLRNLRIKKVPIFDMIFNPVRQAMGGCCRLIVCAGSYMPPELSHFMRLAFNCDFVIGYGLSETSGPILGQADSDCHDGTCGIPYPCGEVKLVDVEEMGFFASKKEGELLVRGAGVISGYYKNPEEQKINFEDGWLKTGDIFRVTESGQLQMVGRRKEIIKLSQGEYVSIQKLMNIYTQVKGVAQLYIHAGMSSRFLTAVAVLENGFAADENFLLKKFAEIGKENKLNGFEMIRGVFISPEEFSPANGLLTPSMKQCRRRIAEKYAQQLQALEAKSA
ncbi:AMP-binding enzyme family protein [Trichomonas vaginalis G3]|uniref:AMP-binding enzyme family protein n=1 Tax=Trichomonas vaginalis (strain ATCC PRA-98 / G3) TaxID=412133 RepID=A2E2S2_TRIV3|nr:long chain fatty acid--CoA ligase family [Trichomonas vaginalis G3]EAY13100.1 AMP-binding enzyme family protein [Trichomonas vaginalis G3]KAI5548289.1 long chain fatty acid--CoA ligase family [Trichomonas vaginalis G3]|eukprot:XP_001325323.1 AMP-binding enzyme family protein [Trichomonas vaginalis G3]